MKEMLKPIRAESLKDLFVARFEELILSGRLNIGEKLPSERELALQLGVSRPVVHEGLVELAARGLVVIQPRVGTVVADFRKEGSLALLNSLVNHRGGLGPGLFEGMLEMRQLFEVETARLAALRRTEEQALEILAHVALEEKADPRDLSRVTDLDFDFHHLVAMASGNLLYPMLLNSFREVYKHLAGLFYDGETVAPVVFRMHRRIADSVAGQDPETAVIVMAGMLEHGRNHLKDVLKKEGWHGRSGG